MKQMIRKITAAGLFAAMLLTAFPTMPISAASEFLGDIRWDFVTDSEGFGAKSGGEIVGVSGGVLQMSTTTNDPNISAYNLRIISNEHKYLRFRRK